MSENKLFVIVIVIVIVIIKALSMEFIVTVAGVPGTAQVNNDKKIMHFGISRLFYPSVIRKFRKSMVIYDTEYPY